ncbi:hypothetical protein QQ045_015007 [Rhodiola kirilowii]
MIVESLDIEKDAITQSMQVDIVGISSQMITAKVKHEDRTFLCSFVYASTDRLTRRTLWDDLSAIAQSANSPWILTGDFNIVATCFKDVVSESWDGQAHVNPLITFGLKLKRLRSALIT